MYLAEEKIEPEVVDNMRTWEHSGFSVDQSVLLAAGDQAGIERRVQYMTRCPFIEPPPEDVIEKILRHCGLWPCSEARPPPANGKGNGVDGADRPDTEPHELTYVDMDTFLANF